MNKKRFISALLVVVMVFTSLHLDSIDVKAMTEADNSIVYSYNDTDKTAYRMPKSGGGEICAELQELSASSRICART